VVFWNGFVVIFVEIVITADAIQNRKHREENELRKLMDSF